MADAFDRIVQRLRAKGCRVRTRAQSPDSMRATCPAHSDHNPSLVVTRRDGGVLVHCFAGCKVATITRALGMTLADLFDTHATERRIVPQIVATYPYMDLWGNPVAEKVRFTPKAFKWRIAADVWGLHGRTVNLYRLPELIDERQVLRVEGEKAVDRLWALRFAATCAPHGADHWLDDYAVTLCA